MRVLSKEFCFGVAFNFGSRTALQKGDEPVYNKCLKERWLDILYGVYVPKYKTAKDYNYKYQKAWKKKNKDRVSESGRVYRSRPCIATREKIRGAKYRSVLENKARRAEYEKRRTFLKKCSKAFLSKEHIAAMVAIYEEAARLTETSGERYEVDHIVPLKGKTVTGLHVPWNLQVIKQSENRRKSNSFDGLGGY